MKRSLSAGIFLAVFAGVLPLSAAHAQTSSRTPDVIYYNGKIVTVNARFEIAQAIAVYDGRIAAVGSNESVRALASASTRFVDLQGKTMLPGFYDNHAHLLLVGVESLYGQVEDEGEGVFVTTPAELQSVLQRRAAEVPKGQWITGTLMRPYFHMKMPSRWELDKIVPDHPVALGSGHKMTFNSLALQKAGVTRDSPDPVGGTVVRNEKGEPTGITYESPAHRLITRVIPKKAMSDAQAVETLRRSLQKFAPMGVTSVNIAGMRPYTFRWLQQVYERWGEELPRMTMQVRLSPGYDRFDDREEGVKVSIAELESLGFRTGMGTDRLKIGAVKMSVDGGLAAPAFWTIEPYDGVVRYDEKGSYEKPTYQGDVRIPEDVIYRVSKRAHELGWQLGIHAIGDAAAVATVNALERILKESPRADHRHYIHHFSVKTPEATLKKIADLGLIVSTQPNFTYFNTAFVVAAMKGERLETQNPQKSLVEHGIRLSYGSDGLPYGPMLGIWSAVTRRGYDGKVYGAQEAVSVEDAIRFYTLGTAYMTFDEKNRGSLEVGKVADMVVLGEDILTVDPLRIRDIAIERTIIGGKEVFTGRHVQPYYQVLPTESARR